MSIIIKESSVNLRVYENALKSNVNSLSFNIN